jgi:hypothetical protein
MLVMIVCRTFVLSITSCSGVREVLDDHDHLGARIVQLVLQLARGVERVDVHHCAAGAQDPEQAHRVLQDVGHHQRDACALGAADALQVRAERGRQRVELGERNRLAHARERLACRVHAHALLEHVPHRRVFVHVDLRGDALRILLDPDPFPTTLPPRTASAGRSPLQRPLAPPEWPQRTIESDAG